MDGPAFPAPLFPVPLPFDEEPEEVVAPNTPNVRKTIKLELPGDWPNGATIHIDGTVATIQVEGVDSAGDLVKILQAARQNGATKGSLYTNQVVDDHELARYLGLVKRGQTRFGGKVTQLGPDRFRLDFDELPCF